MTAKLITPTSLGWLRRPELDTKTVEAWELPDGQLYAHDKRKPPLALELNKGDSFDG